LRSLSIIAAVSLLITAAPALAQPDPTNAELGRRLEQLERQVDRLERELDRQAQSRRDTPRRPEPRREVTAAVSLLCGANCGSAARSYCRGIDFGNGVALKIERKGIGNFEHVVQVRCFN